MEKKIVETKPPRKKLYPTEGGCWFCYHDQCDAFDTEWDTYLHIECLEKALAEDPDHPEAVHMKYLLGD